MQPIFFVLCPENTMKGMKEMAKNRQSTNSNLFRILVYPAVLLCVIFRKPVFQWIAVSALAIWLLILLISALRRSGTRRKCRRSERKLARLRSNVTADTLPETELSERELFLIRQINIRITEQLKETYPMVSWVWLRRPTSEELCAGGAWRIQTSNTEPFNYGEVSISKLGKISITMLQATPLGEAAEFSETDDLTQDELQERPDLKRWYLDEGGQIIGNMIDDLNTQGHKKLIIHEDGEVCIRSASGMKTVDTLRYFPPRMDWSEFCQLLSEDEITATIEPDGLLLSW